MTHFIEKYPKVFAAICAIASGCMLSQIWHPDQKPWFLPVALIPIFYVWLTCKIRWTPIWSAWTMQFAYGVTGFDWLRLTSGIFYGTGPLGSILFLIGFASIAHLGWVVIGSGCALLKSPRHDHLPLWLRMTLLGVFATWVDCIFPQFFPVPVGQPWLWSSTPIFQLAEWTGFKGLSSVTFALNLLLTVPWILRTRKAVAVSSFSALTLFGVLCLLGSWRSKLWTAADGSLKTHLVQVFIEPIEVLEDRLGRDKANEVTLDRFFDVQKLDPKAPPDLIVWSETALPFDVSSPSRHLKRFSNFVKSTGVPIITGAYRYDSAGLKFNTAAHFDGDGNLLGTADKRTLMPFGEYLPGEEVFPILRQWLPQIPVYGRGKFETPFTVGQARLGVGICYDALFPDESRGLTAKNANILLTLTGEFWFGPTAEPFQHGGIAMGRAIEFRRPMIRVADTGVTSVILANGEVPVLSPVWSEWQKTLDVPFLIDPPRTFFDLHGNYIPWFVLMIFILLLGMASRHRKTPVALANEIPTDFGLAS